MKPNLHRILLNEDATFVGGLSSPSLSTQPHLPPPPHQPNSPRSPTSTIDSSMAVTILVLLTALFFMGFISIYARRLAEEAAADISRRRGSQPPSNPHGVDPTAVPSLPLVAYHGCRKKGPLECAVCLSEFEEKETVKIIPACGHVYHPECIDSWLASCGSCPLCRSTRFFPSEREVSLDVFDEMAERVGEGLGVVRRSRSWCERFGRGALLQRSYSF